MGAEFAYIGLIEAFFFCVAEVVFIVEMDEANDSPEVVDPVGVIEWHAPAVGLGRETAQKQYPGVLGQEGFKRMLLYIHRSQRYKMCKTCKRGLSPITRFCICIVQDCFLHLRIVYLISVILWHEKQGIIVNRVFTM